MKPPFPKIKRIWFTDNHICAEIEDGRKFSQPLEMYPTLFFATPNEREDFYIWSDDTSIRWEKLDEDIHVTNFFDQETVNYDNEVNNLLSRFPWLDLKEFAQYIGMHWTKLARYRFGVWTPGPEVLSQIINGIKSIANEMSVAVL